MEVQCLVADYNEGHGKFEDQVGYITIGMWNPIAELYQDVSIIHPGTDIERSVLGLHILGKDRNTISNMHIVVKVECSGYTEEGNL